jgi:beta-propeller repeat-containing protein
MKWGTLATPGVSDLSNGTSSVIRLMPLGPLFMTVPGKLVAAMMPRTARLYFKGPENQWKTGLRTYARVIYPDLWPGSDLVYEGSGRQLKYTFHVNPGADPARIKLAYRGATAMVLDRGRLEVPTPLGGFTDERPYAYQDVHGRRVEIPTAYAVDRGQHRYGFSVGAYDRTQPLVLDASFLVYAGFIGGTAEEQASDIGDHDAFVAKVKADGTGLVYAGFIGGSGREVATAIAVDSAGNAYVAGETSSGPSTFPVKLGPGLTFNGEADAFVAKAGTIPA